MGGEKVQDGQERKGGSRVHRRLSQQGHRKGSYHLFIGHFPSGIWFHLHSSPMRVVLIPYPFYRQGPEPQRDRVGLVQGPLDLKQRSWDSNPGLCEGKAVSGCQLSVTTMLSMRYHFYMALASFFSHGEAGPCLCGDQGLAVAKWKKLYDTLLSNKNRIYNCINDESSQKNNNNAHS